LDVLLVPGGSGRRQQQRDERTLNFIRTQYPRLHYLASVCTGTFILAEAGLLDTRVATTHRSALEELAQYRDIQVTRARLTRTGNVICAAGVSSGIDLALYLVGEVFDAEMAERIAAHIEYEHTPHLPATSANGDSEVSQCPTPP
ncbi:MAG: DJ-1/PfpI family protein, partial [Bacillota bacterium]